MNTCVALIPARSGSKRIPDKNIKLLNGHPLLSYTIVSAKKSGIFTDVVVSTDDSHYKKIAEYYGAEVPFLREKNLASDQSPDIDWVTFTLNTLSESGRDYDAFSILRPTSPFRQPETIIRAWNQFLSMDGIDSLRAVEMCNQHPGKMWIIDGEIMHPLLPYKTGGVPWHSMPFQSLPEIYIQNASLEIAWRKTVTDKKSIAGSIITPFFTNCFEGFDINKTEDWEKAEDMIKSGVVLPFITKDPYM